MRVQGVEIRVSGLGFADYTHVVLQVNISVKV